MSRIGNILKNAKENNKKYNRLWGEVNKLVYSIAYSYAIEHNYDYNDVKQNSYLAWRNLTRTFNLDKMAGNNIEANYISYLNKFLPKRLNDYKYSYSLYKDPDATMTSIDSMNSYEFLDEQFQDNNINNDFIKILDIEDKKDVFSPREKEVYELLKKGFDNKTISEILEINNKDIYRYKKRIRDKIS